MNPDTDEGLDAMLRALPYPDSDRVFDDALLHRYRRGELDEQSKARVEQLLLDSPRARAVLAEAIHPVDEALIERLEKVVAPAESASSTVTRWGFAAVAVALAASLLALVLRPTRHDFAPQYGVAAVGGRVQDVRDAPEAGLGGVGPLRFVPDGRVKIVLQPQAGHSGGTPEATVFRVGDDGRLMAVQNVGIERGQGGIRIQGRARDLLGGGFGSRRLHVVFTPDGEQPVVSGRTPDEARAAVCETCWLTIDAELVAKP